MYHTAYLKPSSIDLTLSFSDGVTSVDVGGFDHVLSRHRTISIGRYLRSWWLPCRVVVTVSCRGLNPSHHDTHNRLMERSHASPLSQRE